MAELKKSAGNPNEVITKPEIAWVMEIPTCVPIISRPMSLPNELWFATVTKIVSYPAPTIPLTTPHKAIKRGKRL